jgi:zinc protease
MTSSRNATAAPSAVDRSRAPAPGALRPFHFPHVERFTLSNGVPVAFAPVRDFPVVTLNVLLDAGGLRDGARLTGIAALTANLLESGTGSRTVAQIAQEVETLGVQLDTGAGWDTAHAGITALSSRLEPAAGVLAEIVQQPSFPQDEVDRLRAERVAEILQRRVDPRSLAAEAAARFIYAPDARFARPLGGTVETLERLNRSDAAAFHARHFQSGSARMVMVGDMDADAAGKLLESQFGGWAGGATEPLSVQVTARSDEPQVVIVDRPGAVQSEVRIGHLGVPRSAANYFSIVVMNAILGGMFSSRLNLNLRERHGYTYGASSGFAMRRHAGSFVVSTAVQTEVTAAAVTEIFNELRHIREAPVSEAELQDARNYFAGVFPLRLQTTDGIAGRLIELLVYDLPENYYDTYRQRILAVTAADAHQAAVHHLQPERAVVVVVGDAAALRSPLEDLGLGAVHVVKPDQIQAQG